LDKSGPQVPVTGTNQLISAIQTAMAWTPSSAYRQPEFHFTHSLDSAIHNARLLEEANFDIQDIWRKNSSSPTDNKCFRPDQNSITMPGTEFRPVHLLQNVFIDHPALWPRVRRMLEHGFRLPLKPLEESKGAKDVEDALAYGNHKSAMKHPEPLRKILGDEVHRGWQLVIPKDIIPRIPGAIVSPMGIIEQSTIDEFGRVTTKWRVTHDQSFAFSSGTSVNSRVQEEKLLDCLYGWALKRFLHAIVHYRSRFPITPLVMANYDLKAAYRRIHFTWKFALQSIVTLHGLSPTTPEDSGSSDPNLDQLALISLRMTFGGSPHPSEFSALSECLADLTNALLQVNDWDPDTLFSEHNDFLDDKPRLENDTVPFAPARELLMDLQLSDRGAADVFIDDIFNVFPLLSEAHWKRGRNAALLAIDCVG
jgi:hypothetical protein